MMRFTVTTQNDRNTSKQEMMTTALNAGLMRNPVIAELVPMFTAISTPR
jgi:hypothetical protein